MDTVYKQVSPAQVANYAYKDPWFALGMLLAQNYNKNYNDRGVNKSVEALKQSLGPSQEEKDLAEKAYLDAYNAENQDYTKLNQALDNVEKTGLTGMNKLPYSEQAGRAGAYERLGNQVGLKADNPFMGNTYNLPRLSNQDANLAGPAYTEEGQSIIKELANQQAAQRLANFDLDKWKSEQTAELLKQGRTPEQIEKAINIVMPQAQAVDKRNKDNITTTVLQNYPELANIYKLQEANPEMAELLANNTLIPARTKFAAEMADKRQDKALQNAKDLSKFKADTQLALKEKEYNQKIAELRKLGYSDNDIRKIILGGGSTRSNSAKGTSQKSIIGSDDFKFAYETKTDLEEKMRSGEKLTPYEQQKYEMVSNYVDNAVQNTYGSNNPTGTEKAKIDFNDYNQVTKAIQDAFAKGYTVDQILPVLKKRMGDGEMYRNIESTLLKKNKPKSSQKSTDDDTPLFSDWGGSQHTGLLGSLDKGFSFRDYLDKTLG